MKLGSRLRNPSSGREIEPFLCSIVIKQNRINISHSNLKEYWTQLLIFVLRTILHGSDHLYLAELQLQRQVYIVCACDPESLACCKSGRNWNRLGKYTRKRRSS